MSDDLIRRKDAIDAVIAYLDLCCMTEARFHKGGKSYNRQIAEEIFDNVLAAEPKQGEWIPVKWHEITDKEREEEGYPEEWSVFIDSVMPNDGERILVTTKQGEVEIDTCCEDDRFYLDSGWDWVDDIAAWMPLPEPWKGADDE